LKSKWFKKDNLIILVLMGVLIFIVALPSKDSSGDDEINSTTQNDSDEDDVYSLSSEDEYVAQLESRLEEILSGVDGVGKVKVMVTLAASEEIVIEKDTPSSRSQTNESDSGGGTRIVTQMENDEETVYITEGTKSTPYVVKTIVPEIEGVVVVGQGCGKGSVDKTVTEIVQALLGIEAHKVKVAKLSE
jgi:stage III sporulation protein AG